MTWYKEGLRFKCFSCGRCCKGSPGYVWLETSDVEKIATFLSIEQKDFLKKFCREKEGRLALKELSYDFSCIFLKDARCFIYPVRPKQCKTFPFWNSILSSEENWNKNKKVCMGIDSKDGKIFSREEIEQFLKN